MAIVFFTINHFDWFKERGARSINEPQREQNKTITSETHLKIAAKIKNKFMGKMLARKWKLSLLRLILIGLEKDVRVLLSESPSEQNKTITFD